MNEKLICNVHGVEAPHCICALVARAEERGRRRGVEEAIEFVERQGYGHAGYLARMNFNLAPRDSGKVDT